MYVANMWEFNIRDMCGRVSASVGRREGDAINSTGWPLLGMFWLRSWLLGSWTDEQIISLSWKTTGSSFFFWELKIISLVVDSYQKPRSFLAGLRWNFTEISKGCTYTTWATTPAVARLPRDQLCPSSSTWVRSIESTRIGQNNNITTPPTVRHVPWSICHINMCLAACNRPIHRLKKSSWWWYFLNLVMVQAWRLFWCPSRLR
jgi:hypothetical protein